MSEQRKKFLWMVAARREELLRLQKNTLPKSALEQAVNYTFTLWKKLTVFLEHPVVGLSNNLGDKQAGPRVAAILSIAETCKRQGLPLRDYLLAALHGMANRKHHDTKTSPPPAGNSVTPDRVRQGWGCSDAYVGFAWRSSALCVRPAAQGRSICNFGP
ncbi:MAG: transposase [Bryobacterales bacterium]|nr:transposase [Bryobacterales bacterium]